ncbi:MAG: S-layer homology domain-containing protein, partial [Phormidesmis sp.]
MLAQAPISSPIDIEFSDIPADYWANPYLLGLSELGIISGFPDGTFRPSQPVTRAEFAAILNKAFPQPLGSSALSFDDVSEDYWA